MSDLSFEILDEFKKRGQYNFYGDLSVKPEQENAIDELVDAGYISIKKTALGYVIAEVLM